MTPQILRPVRFPVRLALSIVISLAGAAGAARADTLLQENFALFDRPTGLDGALVMPFLHLEIDGFWAHFPSRADERWTSPPGKKGAPSWAFSVSSDDPLERPLDEGGSNGTLTGTGNAVALLPFSPPAAPYFVTVDLIPLGINPTWIAVGFTSSSVLNTNFVAHGQLWMRLGIAAAGYPTGEWNIFTSGGSVPLASGTTILSGFNQVRLGYDPITNLVTGSVNGAPIGPIAFSGDSTRPAISYVGLEVSAPGESIGGHANNFSVETGAVPVRPIFHRGDANSDGGEDLSDAVFVLGYLFLSGAAPGCLETADIDGDGKVDLTDPVFLLQYLFLSGSPPALPGPSSAGPCGPDPDLPGSPGDLGCLIYPSCS